MPISKKLVLAVFRTFRDALGGPQLERSNWGLAVFDRAASIALTSKKEKYFLL